MRVHATRWIGTLNLLTYNVKLMSSLILESTHRDLYRLGSPSEPGFTSDGLLNRKMRKRDPTHRHRLDDVFAIDGIPARQDHEPALELQRLECSDVRLEPFYDAVKGGHPSDHFGVGASVSL